MTERGRSISNFVCNEDTPIFFLLQRLRRLVQIRAQPLDSSGLRSPTTPAGGLLPQANAWRFCNSDFSKQVHERWHELSICDDEEWIW